MFTSFVMDSPGIRYIRKMGRQKGYEEGKQISLHLLLGFIQARFPDLLELAKRQVQFLTSAEQIQELFHNLLQAQSYREARRLLRSLGKEPQANEVSLL